MIELNLLDFETFARCCNLSVGLMQQLRVFCQGFEIFVPWPTGLWHVLFTFLGSLCVLGVKV
jgi:hypothetical protein